MNNSFYCTRENALDFIYKHTGEELEYNSNEVVGWKLQDMLDGYSFTIVDEDFIPYVTIHQPYIHYHTLEYLYGLVVK